MYHNIILGLLLSAFLHTEITVTSFLNVIQPNYTGSPDLVRHMLMRRSKTGHLLQSQLYLTSRQVLLKGRVEISRYSGNFSVHLDLEVCFD